ncbi:MAG: protein kinase [Acidobacteria bacterium]|nr:protein kinase [Acidobacteriota bacterium]
MAVFMSDPHWEKAKDIFQAALEKPAGAERESFLDAACAGDAGLRGEVLGLLAAFDDAAGFLDEPPIAEVAETIAGRRESLRPGQSVGRYRIERKLGAGGVGEVFLARDTELERPVALKILAAEFSGHPDHVRRFLQEARAASALNHPNILTIYESGQFDTVRFIAAEYVEGETLRERLRRAPGINPDELLEIVAQTAAALGTAHRAGIVHRDIKPENIMIRADGLVKVLDFGLAKLVEKETPESRNIRKTDFRTTPGLVMGTVAYMSPEQARGLPADERADVWSLGVCLSEGVFGVQPFPGDTTSDQIAAILRSEPAPETKETRPELRRIIGKCLEKKAADRYPTIDDFLREINEFRQENDLSAAGGAFFPAARAISGAAPPIAAPPVVSSAEYIVRGLKKHKFFALAAALAAAALGLLLYFAVFHPFPSAAPIRSIAVLPFVNVGGDADVEYLSDGLSESLINKLSRLSELRVASRSSAFQYRNSTAPASEIARALGVEAVVSGRVARRGDELQISVEMIDAADNTQLWGETYRRKFSDAQTVQEEIAQNILRKLRLTPSETQARSFNSPITDNAQAYQLYLNGVFYRRKNGPENVRKAVEYQNQAIALDPAFALAYAELGYDYYIFVGVGAVDSRTGLPPARQAIEKALSLNDALAEAHDINARLKTADFDWPGAETEIRRAVELNPNLASAHTFYSELLTETGRFDEALAEIEKARELDPLRINLVNYEAEILFRARRYDDAQATFESGNPEAVGETFALISRARVAAARNRYPEALALVRKSLDKDVTTKGLVHLGRLYALTGDRAAALAVRERLKKIDLYVSPAELAILDAALGMREPAFANLERAFAERDLLLPLINVEPEYDTLRDDPRFADLLRRINLKNPAR